jgi:voltage-gated potassium channel
MLDVIRDPSTRPVFIYAASLIVVGAIVFHWLEGWNWVDSFYFVVITLTTIGYGDLSPTTQFSKLVTIFFALNGVAILLMLFNAIRHVRRKERAERRAE